jgi:glycosyltransferase involved in cell wall biosynthesis
MGRMKPYTILHTIETSGIGGAENVLFSVASRLDRRQYRSIAVVPERGLLQEALEANGVRTYIVDSKHWWDLRLPRGLSRLARAEGVDLIHAHLPDQNFYSCVAGMMAGCKTLVTYHGPLDLRDAGSFRGSLKLRVVRSSAASVVAVCDVVKQVLLSLGFPSSRLARIYNGIDVDAFKSAGSAGLREQFGWPAETKVVGMVANVRISKGYEYFVRAARRALDANPSVRFVSAGDVDPVLGGPIVQLVRDLQLQNHYQFLGFRPDVPELMRDLDVFVLSSTSEGFPLVLLEAMAAGKAVVATRCGGPEELVEDGVNGYLVAPGDDGALCDRIVQLLTDEGRAQSFRAKARETAQRFTVGSMITDYQNLYQRILATNPVAAIAS